MNTQTFPGNLREGWPIVAVVSDPETGDWNVQAREANENGWRALKVSAVKPMPIKANYWFGWNGQRVSKTHDSESMKEHRPELLNLVIETVQNLHSPESRLTAPSGAIPLQRHIESSVSRCSPPLKLISRGIPSLTKPPKRKLK